MKFPTTTAFAPFVDMSSDFVTAIDAPKAT